MKGFGQGSRSTIHTVCNTVQSVHVRYSPPDDSKQWVWESLNIPTPMVVLQSAKTGDIHSAMTSMSLICGNQVGSTLQAFGLEPTSVKPLSDAFLTEVMVGDSLKANRAAWRIERSHLASRRESGESRVLGLEVRCLVHQLNLVRKPMVLSISGFWTNLVRLAHLFEQYSFRQSFSASLLHLLQSPEAFQRDLQA